MKKEKEKLRRRKMKAENIDTLKSYSLENKKIRNNNQSYLSCNRQIFYSRNNSDCFGCYNCSFIDIGWNDT